MKRSNWLGATSERLDIVRGIETYVQSNTIPSTVLVSNSTGLISSSVTTLAELAHLSGIESGVQTQITGLREDVYGTPVDTSIQLGSSTHTSVKSAVEATFTLASGINTTVDTSIDSSSTNPVQNSVIHAALSQKEDSLELESTPTINSLKYLNSGAIYNALTNYATNTVVAGKQDTLTENSKLTYL